MVTVQQHTSISNLTGELLTASGIITREIYAQALQQSQKSGSTVGRVLVNSGYIAEGDLRSALKAAQLVIGGRLNHRHAVMALKEACRQCLPLEEILNTMSCHHAGPIGQLILFQRNLK